MVQMKIDSSNIDLEFQTLQSGFVWGNKWGTPWGNYTTEIEGTIIREKGNRISLDFTNKGLDDNGTNIIFYGFVISYKPLVPHQYGTGIS
jgi:hypothetical protein